jgi:AcrR family transcriptional regulator
MVGGMAASSGHAGPSGTFPGAEERILQAAVELFGAKGFAATSVRALAAAAGVSPGLVIHYFGSKDGLRLAAEQEMLARVAAHFERAADVAEWSRSLEQLLDDQPAIVAYLRRALLEQSDAGARLFDRLLEVAEATVTSLQQRGAARRADDPKGQTIAVMAVNLGPILLGQHIERHLGSKRSGRSHEATRRWVAAETDLLTHGFFVPPGRRRSRRSGG